MPVTTVRMIPVSSGDPVRSGRQNFFFQQVCDFEIVCGKTLPCTPALGKVPCLGCRDLLSVTVILRDEPADTHVVSGKRIRAVQSPEDGELGSPPADSPDLHHLANDRLRVRLIPE